jgi:hypothetical protein
VVLKDSDSAVPPTPELALPPIPIIKPLFTILTVSPVAPPVVENPGVAVELDHRYTPEFIVMVMSDFPAIYPEMLDKERTTFAPLKA